MSIFSCFVDDRAGPKCKGRHSRSLAARVTALLTVLGIETADHIMASPYRQCYPAALCRFCWRAGLQAAHRPDVHWKWCREPGRSLLQGLSGRLTGRCSLHLPLRFLTLKGAAGLRPAERVALACSTSDRGVRIKHLHSVLGPQTGFLETDF